ncbi:MAG: hypothetical protein J0L87_02250 [Bacteroidetes bacterium]|nr:hypothetical protein [Bacteroidota bacterium]
MKKIFFLLFITLIFRESAAQENQNIELSKLSSGNYPVYKVLENNGNFKFEAAAKPWPINFTKAGEEFAEIVVNRAGIIEEKYQADLPGFPAYFKSATSDIVITAIDKKIYYYSYSVKSGASIKYIFSESKVKNYADEKSTLDNYRTSIKELQTNTRTQRIEEKNALAAKLEEENTLNGKVIKSINVVPVSKPSEIGLLSIISIGVEFTLDNGKVLKTKNLGGHTPYADFESEVSGGEFAGGDFKVADDCRKIPGDKIEITVWSKFDAKKIKGKYSCPINYKADVNYNFSGSHGASGRGGTVGYSINGKNGADGKNININVTAMQLNGESVNKIVITDMYSGGVIAECKLNANYTLNINANGGNGGNGSVDFGNGGNAGDGGNGGNVAISGTGASSLKSVISNKGGTGGVGGNAKNQSFEKGKNGKNGNNGIISK